MTTYRKQDFSFQELSIPGLILIQPKLVEDERGFFAETYNAPVFAQNGIHIEFVQDNHSLGQKGVLRGLHFQKAPYAQDKLVRVIEGEVFDVAVDIRPGSPTYGKWESVILSAENKQMLLVPRGFAHGFLALSDRCQFLYKTSNIYSADHEGGIIWNDPDIGIKWPISDPQLSGKDKLHPPLAQLELQTF